MKKLVFTFGAMMLTFTNVFAKVSSCKIAAAAMRESNMIVTELKKLNPETPQYNRKLREWVRVEMLPRLLSYKEELAKRHTLKYGLIFNTNDSPEDRRFSLFKHSIFEFVRNAYEFKNFDANYLWSDLEDIKRSYSLLLFNDCKSMEDDAIYGSALSDSSDRNSPKIKQYDYVLKENISSSSK